MKTRGLTKTRGRRVAIWLAGVGMCVLLLTGSALRDRIAEEYWLWRLERGDADAQKTAAEGLGEIRSVRAVPLLVDRLVARSDAGIGERAPVGVSELGVEHGTVTASWDYQGHVQEALVKIGAPAVPVLVERLRGEGVAPLRFAILAVLGDLGSDARDAVPILRELVRDPVYGTPASVALGRIEDAVEFESGLESGLETDSESHGGNDVDGDDENNPRNPLHEGNGDP